METSSKAGREGGPGRAAGRQALHVRTASPLGEAMANPPRGVGPGCEAAPLCSGLPRGQGGPDFRAVAQGPHLTHAHTRSCTHSAHMCTHTCSHTCSHACCVHGVGAVPSGCSQVDGERGGPAPRREATGQGHAWGGGRGRGSHSDPWHLLWPPASTAATSTSPSSTTPPSAWLSTPCSFSTSPPGSFCSPSSRSSSSSPSRPSSSSLSGRVGGAAEGSTPSAPRPSL